MVLQLKKINNGPINGAKTHQGLLMFCMIGLLLTGFGCVRKDVDRHGEMKMRGERHVKLKGKKPGDRIQKGVASWYGRPFHGRKTANGERYDMNQHTAAHKSLPFGTWILVKNLDNGRQTRVRINDRGPFKRGRIIDLSRGAAQSLDMIGTGTARVALYLDASEDTPKRRAAQPKPRTPTVGPSCWQVQVGSFSELARARTMIYRLEGLGLQAGLSKFEGLYRVRLGGFSKKSLAMEMCDRIKNNDIDCFVLCDQ